MAMSRLILKKLTHTHMSPLPCTSQLIHRFSSTTDHHEKQDTKEVSISDSTKKSELSSPRRRNRMNRSLWWKNNDENFPFHPLSGIGNAVVEAAANMNRLIEKLSPARLIRKFKEKDEMYSIKYHMPGLTKDDVKITVEDGMLFIRGQHQEEEEGKGSDDDEFWSAVATYGYYNTSLMLPEDAKMEDIKAEMKDGVLHVVIPKDKTGKKHIMEVHVD